MVPVIGTAGGRGGGRLEAKIGLDTAGTVGGGGDFTKLSSGGMGGGGRRVEGVALSGRGGSEVWDTIDDASESGLSLLFLLSFRDCWEEVAKLQSFHNPPPISPNPMD